MIDAFTKFYDFMLLEFSWKKLLYTLFVVVVVVGGAAWWDSKTGFITLSRLDRTADLSEKIYRFDEEIAGNTEYEPIALKLKAELCNELGINTEEDCPARLPQFWIKFISSAGVWLVIYGSLSLASKKGTRHEPFFGGLIIAFLGGAIGAFVPTWKWPWFNCVVYPLVIQIVLMVVILILVESFRKARAAAVENACRNNMRIISAAKEEYAIDNGLHDGSDISRECLSEYIRGGISACKCQGGGLYLLRPLGSSVECTTHGSLE